MTEMFTTYEPDNSLKKGYFGLIKEIFKEIKDNQWLIYQLFKRDFLSIYRQSFIGVLWAVIIPIVSVATFIILRSSQIFSMGEIDVPYPIFAILGMAFWQFFSRGVVAASQSLVSAGSMIVKINFSKKSLVIASIGQAIVAFLVQIILVLLLFIYYQYTPNIAILLVPFMLIPLFLITLGFGFILSILNGVMRDIGNILSSLMTFLMFLTPVLYARPAIGFLARITRFNPFYYLISAPRELVLQGTISEVRGYIASIIVSIFVFIIFTIIFHLTETRVAERI
jgi:lipopolysaccharide transport system permease protein